MLNKNVVLLNTKTIYNSINQFLNKKEMRSKLTREAYEYDIRQFFKMTRNKDIEYLLPQDIIYTASEIDNYQMYLTKHYSGGSTVNRKMSALRHLFLQLAKYHPDIDVKTNVFDVKNVRLDTKKYGSLSVDEFLEMVELLKEEPNGVEKSLLVEMAGYTSFRLTATLNIKWSDITKQDDYYIIMVYDKGHKLDQKPIRAEFYDRLKVLQKTSINGRVFNLSARTCERMIKDMCDKMHIDHNVKSDEHPYGRNITFHSLKKMGVEYVLQTTGDIAKAAQQGNHSNVQTTYQTYIEMTKTKQIPSMAGLHIGQKIDLSFLDDMSKEGIIRLLETGDVGFQSQLRRLANQK